MKSERRGKFGERKKKVLICAVLFATLAFLSVSVGCASAATTIYVPEGGNQTIQQAVNNATEGDTIIVKDGTYTENVNVNVNHLTIQSENGSASTIVQAAIPDDHVFEITANHVNLSGFAVENATQGTTPYTAGIYLYYVEHCNISDNTVSNNFGGIGLNYSNNNIISNNNASSNMDISIVLGSSNNNTIYNNTASSNTGVDYSGHVYSWGICVGNSSNNNITANTANSNAGDIGWGIYIGGASNNNTLADNNFSNNFFGVYLISSSNNTLTNNIASNNACGIYLWSSSNYNTLTNNTASNSIAYDFYSHENSHGNTVGNLTISSHQTTISFTYDQGIGLKGATTPNSDPPGKVNIGKFVIVMNETANSWIFLNVSYCDADITSTQESTLRMWKYNGTTWTEVPPPNGVNTDENYVYANITSFGIVAPLGNSDGCPCGDICVNTSGWWRAGAGFNASNTPIQHAINNATAEDTICVKDGTYTENVNVSKRLTIQSENGFASTIVQAKNSDKHVFKVSADYVNIRGFRVKNANGDGKAGILLKNVNYCNISNNKASNNNAGIKLYESCNNLIMDNIANNNTRPGIGLNVSSNSIITGNTANSNGYKGINLRDSNNNLIYNNYFNNTNNAHDDGNNIWNISKTEGTNIVGGSWMGGNYWSDYAGEDLDGVGLGDTPYDIPGGTNKDYLPLVKPASALFDTGAGTYPSIMGTHEGKIIPSRDINVNRLYTYPCAGTGGHTESIKLCENDTLIANGIWSGYKDDWHNITITPSVTLLAGHTYNYTIVTGSYPQIIHEPSKDVTGGTITCTSFVDVNGKTYTDWIPAIRLE